MCGCVAILNMVVIGYDRYNVIVKGFSGTKITPGKAACILMAIWGYCIAIALPPLIGVWGGYTTEGMLYTCSYDYLSDTWSAKSYVLFGFFFNYLVPMVMIFFFYSSIVKVLSNLKFSCRLFSCVRYVFYAEVYRKVRTIRTVVGYRV